MAQRMAFELGFDVSHAGRQIEQRRLTTVLRQVALVRGHACRRAAELHRQALDQVLNQAKALDMDEVRRSITEEAKANGHPEGHA